MIPTIPDPAMAARMAKHLGIDPARVTVDGRGDAMIIAVDGAPPEREHAGDILEFMASGLACEHVEEGGGFYADVIAGGLDAPPVESEYAYLIVLPPAPSPRFVEWAARIAAGWRPCAAVRSLGYHEMALWFGVYVAEQPPLRELWQKDPT